MRGLAALYVLLHHAALAVPPDGLSAPGLAVRFLLRHGHFAVAVFIVLSGYCLMRPVAADPAGRLRGGFWAYLGRRARRIVPPYYAALGLSWALIAMVPALAHPPRTWWDRALPSAGFGNVASHLLLVHNLSPRWLFKIDPPSWSVATEWQIYLLFPALLALWRRWGISAAVAAGFAIGFGAACLSGPLGNLALRQACPWYAGLFALGMAAARPDRAGLERLTVGLRRGGSTFAHLSLRERSAAGRVRVDRSWPQGTDPHPAAARPPSPGGRGSRNARGFPYTIRLCRAFTFRPGGWLVPALLGGAAVALAAVALRTPDERAFLMADPLVGAAAALLIVRLASLRARSRRSPLLGLLESRWAVGLGAVSYSLYLVHYPLLALAEAVVRPWGLSMDARLASYLLAASPCCLAAAWLFHRAFERPFLARPLECERLLAHSQSLNAARVRVSRNARAAGAAD